jgi:hypothetical protein
MDGTEQPRWSKAEEFYGRLGIPAPTPMTPEQAAEFERREDDVDDQIRSRIQPSVPNAAQRLAAALGREPAPPMTDQEIAEFEADQDRADADLERLLGLGWSAAA